MELQGGSDERSGAMEPRFEFEEQLPFIGSGLAIFRVAEEGTAFLFHDLNPAAEALCGLQRENVQGLKIEEAFPAAHELGLLEALKKVWKTGVSALAEAPLFGPSGHAVWLSSKVHRLDSHKMVIILEDITRRKLLDDKLRGVEGMLGAINRNPGPEMLRALAKVLQRESRCKFVGILRLDGHASRLAVMEGLAGDATISQAGQCLWLDSAVPLDLVSTDSVQGCICSYVQQTMAGESSRWLTEGGSFWTNGLSRLEPVDDHDLAGFLLHNECLCKGFETLMLVPLRAEGEVIGLLQVADVRPNRLSTDIVEHLEEFSVAIGIALARSQVQQVRKEVMQNLEATVRKQATDLGRNEARWLAFTQSSPDQLLMVGRDGVVEFERDSGTVQAAPPLKGTRFEDCFTVSCRAHAILCLDRVLQTGSPATFTARTEDVDGRVRQLDVVMEPVRIEGQVVGAFTRGRDVTALMKVEEGHKNQLRDGEALLALRDVRLKEKDLALREVMAQVEELKKETREKLQSNVDRVLQPIVARLKTTVSPAERQHLDVLEQGLADIASSFGASITAPIKRLTPREIEICNLIRTGLSTKDIANLMSLSPRSVDGHRNNIRKKLGLKGKGSNLVTYLMTSATS